MAARTKGSPVRVALRNDYEVVLHGFARMLERYRDRIEVVEVLEQHRIDLPVDVALYDTFAQHGPESDIVAEMVANPANAAVAIYTWNTRQDLIDAAVGRGVRGYFAKSLPALELVEGLEAIARGEIVLSTPDRQVRTNPSLEWPGRAEGLSDRESEVLALITQGKSNQQIAQQMHLAENTVKSHIRSAYRKVGAVNRVDAVLWGVRHGFQPDHDAAPWPSGGGRS